MAAIAATAYALARPEHHVVSAELYFRSPMAGERVSSFEARVGKLQSEFHVVGKSRAAARVSNSPPYLPFDAGDVAAVSVTVNETPSSAIVDLAIGEAQAANPIGLLNQFANAWIGAQRAADARLVHRAGQRTIGQSARGHDRSAARRQLRLLVKAQTENAEVVKRPSTGSGGPIATVAAVLLAAIAGACVGGVAGFLTEARGRRPSGEAAASAGERGA